METDQQPATGVPSTPNNALQPSTNNNIVPPASTTRTGTNYSRCETTQPFLLQYKLGNERDRATFLDVFQSFWSGQGYPRNTIPVVDFVNGINFDLYRMYHAVVREGGYDHMRTADKVSRMKCIFRY